MGTHGCWIITCNRCGCIGSGRGSGISTLFFLKIMVIGLKFVLCGVNHETDNGGINPSIVIMNSVGILYRTVVRHATNNNVWDASAVLGSGHTTPERGRGAGGRGGSAHAEIIGKLLQEESNYRLVWYL